MYQTLIDHACLMQTCRNVREGGMERNLLGYLGVRRSAQLTQGLKASFSEIGLKDPAEINALKHAVSIHPSIISFHSPCKEHIRIYSNILIRTH